jgi:Holliday junction resolvase-like predicted endonuclease
MKSQNTANIKELEGRALNAACKFLERQGFHSLVIAEECENFDIVAISPEDVMVFVACAVTTDQGNGFINSTPDREEVEREVIDYLATVHEHSEWQVRFDTISMVVINGNQVLLRHFINALDGDL